MDTCGLWEVFYQDGLWKMRAVDVCGRSSALLSQHCLEVNCTGVPAPAGFGCGVSFNSFSDPIFGHSRVVFLARKPYICAMKWVCGEAIDRHHGP